MWNAFFIVFEGLTFSEKMISSKVLVFGISYTDFSLSNR